MEPAIEPPDGVDGAGVNAIAATRFGGYVLVAKLGQGAMAEVFLALRSGQAGFRKLMVIKRLHAHLAEEPVVRQMFLDEARLAALLGHPNVVQTNEVGEVDAQPFMAMEYLDGQPLSGVIDRCKDEGMPLSPPLLARIVSDALDGLQHAHDLRDLDGQPLHVVHRDVSPHNLYVTYEGVTKVLDFGVAKASLQAAQTEIGAIKGKYAYLSPEQAEQREVDGRTDVWAAGVVLWEGLTGRRLFKRDTEIATLKAVTEEDIPSAREVAIEVPEELSRIAAKALARDRGERYASAQAMRDDLEAYLRAVSEPTSRRDVGRFLRSIFKQDIEERRRAISACVRGEVTDISQAIKVGEASHPSYSTTGSGAPAPSRRTSPFLIGLIVLLSVGLTAAVVWPLAKRVFEAERSDEALASALLAGQGEPATPSASTTESASAEPEATERASGGDADMLRGAAERTAAGTAATGSAAEGAEPGPPRDAQEGAEGSSDAADMAAAAAGADVATESEGELSEGEGSEAEGSEAEGSQGSEQGAGEAAQQSPEAAGRSGSGSLAQRRRAARRAPRARSSQSAAQSGQGAAPATQDGYLYLDTTPWTSVSLGGRSLGNTPLIRVQLPAGDHVLRLQNAERGIDQRYSVTIEPGETTRRRVGLR